MKESPVPTTVPVTDGPQPLFPDQDSTHFEVTKRINMSQLHSELETALKQQIQLSMTRDDVSSVNGYLWIVPSGVDGDVVMKTLADHQEDPEWGIPQSQRDYLALAEKVRADPEAVLSDHEVQVGIKGLLLRQSNG
jgi:hypothetical protein